MAEPKLCECGCGQPTKMAKASNAKRGMVRGEPIRFCHGHNQRSRPIGAVYAGVTIKGRTVMVHRLRAENALGKPLPEGAEVHHADHSKRADAPLVICQSHSYHHFLHARARIVKAGGNPNTERLCATCRTLKKVSEFHRNTSHMLGTQQQCMDCDLMWHRRQTQRRKNERISA